MRYLRTNTATIITVGPFYDKTDGVTIETGLTITNERITFIVDNNDGSAPTLVLDNVTGATSATANDLNYITDNDAGLMQMELAAANVNYLGRAFLSITDAANHVPVFHEFIILPAQVYDSLILGTDLLDSNAAQIGGTAQTGRDIGASVLLSSGTGTGQISLTSGAVLLQATQTGVTIPTVTTVGSVSGAVGSVTGAVGSVTGNVGGNVAGSVASVTGNVGGSVASIAANGITATSIAADAINAAAVKADAVSKIQSGLATPTNITAGTITTVTNLTNAPTAGDFTATMKTSITTAASAATPALSAGGVTAVQSGLATSAAVADVPTVAEFEARTIAAANYATATNLATVDTVVDAIKAKTDNLPTDPADESAVEAAITAATSPLATAAALDAVDNFIDTEVSAIKAVTDKLDTTLVQDGAVFDFTAESLAAAPTGGSAPTAAAIRAEIDANSTQLAAIVADTNELQTDNIPALIAALPTAAAVADIPTNAELAAALAGADDATLAAIAALNNISSGDVQTAAGAALTAYDPPTNAEMEARTIVSASYATASAVSALNDFNPATDTVAHVTLVDTTTTNTDMVGAAPTVSQIRTEMDTNSTKLTAILEDTGTTLPASIAGISAGSGASVAEIEALLEPIALEASVQEAITGIEGIEAGSGATPAEIWTYAQRALTQTAAQVQAAMTGSDLVVTQGVTFAATLTGLTIPATWSKIYLTAKYSLLDEDIAAKLQLMETNPANAADGILYLNGRTATDTQKAYGSLTISQAAGTIEIALSEDLDYTGMLARYTYDVKCLLADGSSQLLAESANMTFQLTETQTV